MNFLFCAMSAFVTGMGLADSVESVRFVGSRAFPARILASVVSVRPGQLLDERKLDADVRFVEQYLHDNGFRAARVAKSLVRGRRQYVVLFQVYEGVRTRVGSVFVTGSRKFEPEQLAGLLPVAPGSYYTAGTLELCAEAVRTKYLNSGFPFVEVQGQWQFRVQTTGEEIQGKRIEAQVTEQEAQGGGGGSKNVGAVGDTLADLVLSVSEGPRCYIGDVRVRGSRAVRAGTVLRALELRAGELFNQRRLQESARRLYATRLFQRVLYNVLWPDSSKDSVVVRFDVLEQEYRAFSVGGGLETPPWRALVSAGWEHLNVLNRGQQFEVAAEYSPNFSGDFRASLDLHYRVPYLILTRVDFQAHPFFYWDRVDTILRREYGIETGLSRSLLRSLSVGLSNRFRLVADTSRAVTNLVALTAQYDSRNDFFEPVQGLYVRSWLEAAGGVLRGDNDFYRLTGEVRGFQLLGFGLVLAGRAFAGRCFTYGRTERVPYYEGFTLGGRNSLRGYPDQSIGPDTSASGRYGPVIVNTNLELRTGYVLNWFGFVSFWDGGEVVDWVTGLNAPTYEHSAGVGIRVRSPIGPVRLDWGKRLRGAPAGDRGRFYLGLLHAF